MKLIFLKTGNYLPLVSGRTKYESLDLLTRQVINPGLAPGEQERLSGLAGNLGGFRVLISSDLKRAAETAAAIGGKVGHRVIFDQKLREVKFSLGDLLTESEYETGGSTLVRRRFVAAFISNSLREDRERIRSRLSDLLKQRLATSAGPVVLVSHSFLMKLSEIYLLKRVDIFSYPHELPKFFDVSQRTYNYGEGFEVEVSYGYY